MSNLKNNISIVLRDPIWQAIGAILGIIAFIVSTLVAYDIYFKSKGMPDVTDMTITQRYSFTLPDDLGEPLAERVTFTLDKTEIKHLVVIVCTIANTGTNPIKPDDFAEPIRVSVESTWEILSIDTGDATPSDINLGWNKVSQNTYEMKPLLLNEQDKVEFLVYLTRTNDYDKIPELSFDGRVVGVKSFIDEPPVLSSPQKSPFVYLQTTIFHSGWSPYLLITLALSFFALTIYIGILSGRLITLSKLQILIFIAIAGISFSTSEILTDLLMPSSIFFDDTFRSINYIEWVLLTLQLLLILYLAYPALKKRFQQKNNLG